MPSPSRFTRPSRPPIATVTSLAAFVSLLVLACGVAAADTVTTNFEPPNFHTGSVNGQVGWRSAPPGAIPSCDPTPTGGQYDQAVVANGAGTPLAFGLQSLRMSNLCGNGEFSNQTYAGPVASPAGENLPNTNYTAQFSFISKTPAAEQPGLLVTVSPDSGEGSRMGRVNLEDTPAGIHVTYTDSPNSDGDFVTYDFGTLDRKVPHTVKFSIKLHPGPDNDLVRISIDGVDRDQCFTTWENYYRTSPEQSPPPNVNNPAPISTLQFRTGIQGPQELATTGGFLFDNVRITTDNGAGPAGCDTPIVKTPDSPTVTAGGRIGYRITVRNRGRDLARNLWACDHIPHLMTFVSADRRLRRVGRARCLVISRLAPGKRAGFHIVLHLAAGAPRGTIDNIADVTPGPGPPTVDVPAPSAPSTSDVRSRVSAKVKALKKHAAARVQPRFTG